MVKVLLQKSDWVLLFMLRNICFTKAFRTINVLYILSLKFAIVRGDIDKKIATQTENLATCNQKYFKT